MDARWIIEAKFEPPRGCRRQIERRRIFARLGEGDPDPVVVQAAAGFGKSTLLAQWAQELGLAGGRVAWLNLDEEDRAAEPFAAYVAEALLRAVREPGAGAPGPHRGAAGLLSGLPPKAALAAAANEVARSGRRVTLILDDYHRAECEGVDALLRGLLERPAPGLRIVVASRTLPRLGLARLKAEGRICLVTDRDLRFNDGETSLFFTAESAAESSADPADWAAFARLAEGWPVALQFARMWLGEGGRLGALGAASEASDLGAYLSEQVFSALPADQRAFLLATASLDFVSEDLAAAIGIAQPGRMLQEIARSGLPLAVLSREPLRLRCHHLLQDFLVARARAEGVDLGAVHRRAAGWFAAAGDLGSAVRHALAGDDPAHAAAIIEAAGGWRLVYRGHGHLGAMLIEVHRLLGAAADRLPALGLGAAVVCAKRGDLPAANALFRKVADGDPPAAGRSADDLAIIDALIRLYCDQPIGEAALAALTDLTARLGDDDPIGRALATNLVAYFQLQNGDFPRARRFGERAIQHFRTAGAEFGELHLYVHVGGAEFASGNRAAAEATYRTMAARCGRVLGEDSDLAAIAGVLEAEALFETGDTMAARARLVPALARIEAADGWFDVFAAGYLTAARLDLAEHGAPAAYAALGRGLATAERRSMHRLTRLLSEETVRIATLAGDLGRAREMAGRLGLPMTRDAPLPAPVSAVRGDGPALSAVRLLIADRRPQAALALIEAASRQLHAGAAPFARRITARLLQAVATAAMGETARAELLVAGALRLAHGENFVRTVRGEGDRVETLAAAAVLADPALGRIAARFFGPADAQVAGGLPETPAAGSGPGDPPLSGREREVLLLLAEGLSNKEIARRLGVDPNTVKYHLKRLFSKLGVERRTRAIVRARSFGLID
ncbi:LuxR C-terminal-related transcriptional regulator [Methylobrevis albus]|uniref:AAA family ATPase n=1 Tax=Methylobrevis albus TaxID=2793297 RepID=A0A931I3F9_9HYPH|nr:LuxR C-terminal-related transcriptional regulator [Methylobrevis albus]MBH0238754.1 AAA family ATPase [Methylobrevis albus]